jgi:hypothetical protein
VNPYLDGARAVIEDPEGARFALGVAPRAETDDVQIPHWLNPAVLPPAEIVDAITAAIHAAEKLHEPIVRFVAEHGLAFIAYEAWYRGVFPVGSCPDDVWPVIDELSGFKRLHELTTEPGVLLAGLDRPTDRDEIVAAAQSDLEELTR